MRAEAPADVGGGRAEDLFQGGSRPAAERVPRLLLTRREAAALSMSVDTFERRVQPFIKVVPCGQLVLVPPRELEHWVATHARYLVEGAA